MDAPNHTYIAVPVALMAEVHKVLDELPHRVSRGLVPAVEQVMCDEHKVDFTPPVESTEGTPAMDSEPTLVE